MLYLFSSLCNSSECFKLEHLFLNLTHLPVWYRLLENIHYIKTIHISYTQETTNPHPVYFEMIEQRCAAIFSFTDDSFTCMCVSSTPVFPSEIISVHSFVVFFFSQFTLISICSIVKWIRFYNRLRSFCLQTIILFWSKI